MEHQKELHLDGDSQQLFEVTNMMNDSAHRLIAIINGTSDNCKHDFYYDSLTFDQSHENIVLTMRDDELSYNQDGSVMYLVYNIENNDISIRVPNTLGQANLIHILNEMVRYDGTCAHFSITIDGEIY